MTLLFTFPGQGVQRASMLTKLNADGQNNRLYQEASSILGVDVLTLDTEEALQVNQNVQLALTLCAIACVERLKEAELRPDYVLGLSIGAYGAAIASGVLSLEQGLKLVALRGKLMSEAYPQGYGMASIQGLSTASVRTLIEAVNKTHEPVYLANINTERQNVLSGPVPSLEYACQLAIEKHATNARLLRVNVPSHCVLLAPQAEELYRASLEVEFRPPSCEYVSANAARVLRDPEVIRRDLTHNMALQTKWWETAEMVSQRGVDLSIEMAPGSVLTKLNQVSMAHTSCLAFETTPVSTLKALAGLSS